MASDDQGRRASRRTAHELVRGSAVDRAEHRERPTFAARVALEEVADLADEPRAEIVERVTIDASGTAITRALRTSLRARHEAKIVREGRAEREHLADHERARVLPPAYFVRLPHGGSMTTWISSSISAGRR